MNSNGSNNNRGNDRNLQSQYIGAPYNFVALPKKVIKRETKENNLPSHNKYRKNYILERSVILLFRGQIFLWAGYTRKTCRDFIRQQMEPVQYREVACEDS